jgi:hypothetical protein
VLLKGDDQEFEYKYRKDHEMLDTTFDLPPSLRKTDDQTPKGPIGRAVWKLTPRKASFANLFKGKGWNKSDEANAPALSGHICELQEISDQPDSLEAANSSNMSESTTLLHAH